MPLVPVYDNASGSTITVDAADAAEGFASGKYTRQADSVVREVTGGGVIPRSVEDAPSLGDAQFDSGSWEYYEGGQGQIHEALTSLDAKATAFANSFLDAATLGLIKSRSRYTSEAESENPGSAFFGGLTGTAATLGFGGPGKALATAGEGLGKAAVKAAGAAVESRLGRAAERAAVEGIAGGVIGTVSAANHQWTDAVIGNKGMSSEAFAHEVGSNALFGGVFGGIGGALSKGSRKAVVGQGDLLDPASGPSKALIGTTKDLLSDASSQLAAHRERILIADSVLEDNSTNLSSRMQQLRKQAYAETMKAKNALDGLDLETAMDASHKGNKDNKAFTKYRDAYERYQTSLDNLNAHMDLTPGEMGPEGRMYEKPQELQPDVSGEINAPDSLSPVSGEINYDGIPLDKINQTRKIGNKEKSVIVNDRTQVVGKKARNEGLAKDDTLRTVNGRPIEDVARETIEAVRTAQLRGGDAIRDTEFGKNFGEGDKVVTPEGPQRTNQIRETPNNITPLKQSEYEAQLREQMSPSRGNQIRETLGNQIEPIPGGFKNQLEGQEMQRKYYAEMNAPEPTPEFPGGRVQQLPVGEFDHGIASNHADPHWMQDEFPSHQGVGSERVGTGDFSSSYGDVAPTREPPIRQPVDAVTNASAFDKALEEHADSEFHDGWAASEINPKKRPMQDSIRQFMDEWAQKSQNSPRVRFSDEAAARLETHLQSIQNIAGTKLDSAGGVGDIFDLGKAGTSVSERLQQLYSMRKLATVAADMSKGIKAPQGLHTKAASYLQKRLAGVAGAKIMAAVIGGHFGGPIGFMMGASMMQNSGATLGKIASASGRVAEKIAEASHAFLAGNRSLALAHAAAWKPTSYDENPPIPDHKERLIQVHNMAKAPDQLKQKILSNMGDLVHTSPEIAEGVADHAVNRIVQISLNAPAFMWDTLGRLQEPSVTKMRQGLEFEQAANNLNQILDAFKSGSMTECQGKALRTCYPEAHQELMRHIILGGELNNPSIQKLRQVERLLGTRLGSMADPLSVIRHQVTWPQPQDAQQGQPANGASGKPQSFKMATQPTGAQSMGTTGRAPGN